MENLNVFVEIILVALAGASLTNFFDDCIQDGMIFGRYGNWLRKEENRNKEIEFHNNLIVNDIDNGLRNMEDVKEFIEPIKENFWKKPIGGCMICTNVYITIFMLIMYKFILILFVIFAIIGVSNTFLKKIIA
jgi:hypothetical protein